MRKILLCGVAVVLGLAMANSAQAQPGFPPFPGPFPGLGGLFRPDYRIPVMVRYGSTVRVQVKNSGLADAKKASWLRVWDVRNGKLMGVRWAKIPALKKGQAIWLSVNFGPMSLAHSTLYARADYFNAILESNEFNNGKVQVIP